MRHMRVQADLALECSLGRTVPPQAVVCNVHVCQVELRELCSKASTLRLTVS